MQYFYSVTSAVLGDLVKEGVCMIGLRCGGRTANVGAVGEAAVKALQNERGVVCCCV